MQEQARGGVAVAVGRRESPVRRRLRRNYREAAERAAWVERHADHLAGFSVREFVLRSGPPKLTLETRAAARASLARREAVTMAGAGYVAWLAATNPEALAEFWRDAKRDDEAALADDGSLDAWNRSFARIERAHARDQRRPTPPVVHMPLVVRRPSCEVRRGRAARPGRRRRSSVSRDDGGAEPGEPEHPAGWADARRIAGVVA